MLSDILFESQEQLSLSPLFVTPKEYLLPQ